jgi:nucleotide-binding universal stress UspA family protein
MFKHIVVGVDRAGGLDAITLSSKLRSEGAQLTLVHIYPADSRIRHPRSAADDSTERRRAAELLAQVREQAGVDASLRFERFASVGRGLHVLAEELGADLLVVGSSRRGLLGRVMIGDDTRAALNGAPCAIAIAPAGYSEQGVAMREIGVGYNGSPESEHAVTAARTIAAEHGAKLSAFEAVSLPTYAFIGGPAPLDGAIEELVQDARQRIETLGGVEPHAVYGHPAEELALYSASLDLLIVGSRDYGPVGRLVHGSTSHVLARTARCPLLVLTRAARAVEASHTSAEDRELALTPNS